MKNSDESLIGDGRNHNSMDKLVRRMERRTQRTVDENDYEERGSMRRKYCYTWDDRDPGINIKPLVRFLNRSCGHRWDEVYSELCNRLKPHELKFVDYLVDTKTAILNGEIVTRDGYTIKNVEVSYGSRNSYYVHPSNGLLCQAKNQPRWRGSDHDPYKKVRIFATDGQNVVYLKVKGIWYKCDLEHCKEAVKEYVYKDKMYKDIIIQDKDGRPILLPQWFIDFANISHYRHFNAAEMVRSVFGALVYPTSKLQLNSVELKRLGLK